MPRLDRLVAGLAALAALSLSALAVAAQDLQGAPLAYPATRRDATVEARHGQSVPDPYRWLEGDPETDPAVADWAAKEDALARRYLAALPGRDAFASSIRALTDIERFSLPRKAGGRYFYLHNAGLQDQSVLTVREGLGGSPRVLLDPSALPRDGALALDDWQPSSDGALVAVALQHDGSDRREVRVLRVAGAVLLGDRLTDVADVPVAWTGAGGFLYSRYPGTGGYGAPRGGAGVWFHRVGTSQVDDLAVHTTPDETDLGHRAWVTSDRHWAVIASTRGLTDKVSLRLVDLTRVARDGWATRMLVADMRDDWRFVEGIGRHLWFVTTNGAPNGRLVRIDLLRGGRVRVREVVHESASTLEAARIVGGRLILSYRTGGALRAVVTDFRGRPRSQIALQGIGTASGFAGRPGDPETFYTFSSFGQPPGVWRLDLATGQISPFALPHAPFDPADILVERHRYPGKDGTMIPIYVVRSRQAAQSGHGLPALLYGYGGFDISINPGYSPERAAWILAGGAFALASVRGGGELGEAWHEAGSGVNKQAAFDDFIAAAEWLSASGIARKGAIAAQGRSNGGLLVAAAINQRPDLFAAANPDVGVYDMLRFDRFTSGRFWTSDYGDPADPADWARLRAFSPYHNVREGDYPAILVTTADHDDRVVPAHSFKYVAALQAARTGSMPHLLRIEHGAGHGSGRPVAQGIATEADVLAFLARFTGLAPPGSAGGKP
ncbi:MAG: S9 family peptidase [Sphingomonadales bacterium]|nr:S9 family peptidase [Sphingomonadales bacterium]MDE2570741.1 S9 family peptidase [Sphingomonadales bacterium]